MVGLVLGSGTFFNSYPGGVFKLFGIWHLTRPPVVGRIKGASSTSVEGFSGEGSAGVWSNTFWIDSVNIKAGFTNSDWLWLVASSIGYNVKVESQIWVQYQRLVSWLLRERLERRLLFGGKCPIKWRWWTETEWETVSKFSLAAASGAEQIWWGRKSLLFSTSRSFSAATQLSSQQCFIFPTSGIWLIYFDTKSAEDAPNEKSPPFCCWLPNILSIIRDSRRMSLKLTPARRSVYIICLHILISFNVLDIYWIFCIS